MRILIYCPVSLGGIAEHIHYQSLALMRAANSTVVLGASDYLAGRRTAYRVLRTFHPERIPSNSGNIARKVQKYFIHAWKIVSDQFLLAIKIIQEKPDFVIIGWYGEYLAPLWVLPHWILARFFKVIYVVNIHDPLRDYVVGPKWWHDLSVRMAYWPISVGVVHQRLSEPSPVPKHVHVVEAPVGVYDLQESFEDPEAIRAAWEVGRRVAPEDRRSAQLSSERTSRAREIGDSGLASDGGNQLADAGELLEGQSQAGLQMDSQKLQSIRAANDPSASGDISTPNESAEISEICGKNPSGAQAALTLDAGRSTLDTSAPADVVFLAFGFIRDNKNLDLVIRALTVNPSAVLVVMGRAQSKKDKPLEFYRNLAAELRVQDRVKFFDGFVPDGKLASYFAAADVVVLTYDGTFHSQSGVLNIAARARRPVLASAGESPLKDCVQKFRLGVFVEPDDLDALKEGIKKVASDEWRVAGGEPDWEGYEAFASWDVNVAKILEGVEEVRKKKKHGAGSGELGGALCER